MRKYILFPFFIFATMLIQTSCNDAPKSSNPLTEESKAPFGAPDFSLYKTSDYMPAFEQGIAETIDWYLAHQDWIHKIVSGEYANYYENMYVGAGSARPNKGVYAILGRADPAPTNIYFTKTLRPFTT